MPKTSWLCRNWAASDFAQVDLIMRWILMLRDVYEIGEVAYWPEEKALCIFWGPTPASRENEPRMASPGAPLDRITDDIAGLQHLSESLETVTLTLKYAPFDAKNFVLPCALAVINAIVQHGHF